MTPPTGCVILAGNESRDRKTLDGMEHMKEAGTPPREMARVPDDDGPTPEGAERPGVMGRWGGLLLIIVAALAFSIHNTTATRSYEHGPTVLTMLASRSWLGIVALGALLWLRRMPVTLSRRHFWGVMALSALFTCQSYFLLASFVHMQVSLAILVFYLFPILVILIAAAIGDERLTVLKIGGAVVAFGGLAVALDIGGGPDVAGVLLAFGAAVCLSLNIVGGARMMKAIPGLVVTLYMMATAVVVLTTAVVLDGGPYLPSTTEGWAWYTIAVVASPIALICFYSALAFTGGPKAAMTMNAEPIFTTIAAVLILGEVLGPLQIVGGVLVIGAIFTVTFLGARGRGQVTP